MITTALLRRALRGEPAAKASLTRRLYTSPLDAALFPSDVQVAASSIVHRRLQWVLEVEARYREVLRDQCSVRARLDVLWDVVLPLAEFIMSHQRNLDHPAIVGIVGGPGAGKTTLARALAVCIDWLNELSAPTLVLSLEDFYYSREVRLRKGFRWRALPGTHDLERIRGVTNAIRSGASRFHVPRYSMREDKPLPDEEVIGHPKTCLLEGWLVGGDNAGYTSIWRDLDLLVYLDMAEDDLKKWRISRERRIRSLTGGTAGIPRDQMAEFWDSVLRPGIAQWVAPIRMRANIVVSLSSSRSIVSADYRNVRPVRTAR